MSQSNAAKNPRRFESDNIGDLCFQWLKSNPDAYQQLNQLKTNEGFFDFLSLEPTLEPVLKAYSEPVPIEFDGGVRFFHRNLPRALMVLGLYSLPYCYAGANGARVLVKSRKLTEDPPARLLETARFVLDVCSKESFNPIGHGYLSAFKVRMMHAAARYYSLREINDEVPVNQEDMLGTLLSFSLIVVRGLRKMGVDVSEREAADYLALWRYVGRLLGIKEMYLPENIKKASGEDLGIQKREFRKSEEGVMLTRALTNYFKSQPLPFKGVAATDIMRYLLGDRISNILQLDPSCRVTNLYLEFGLRLHTFVNSFNKIHYSQSIAQIRHNLQGTKPELQQ